MIEANELRIGNIVWGINKVTNVLNGSMIISAKHIYDLENGTSDFDFYGLEITEERLLKFGFERMEKFPLKYVNKIKDDSLTDFEPVIVIGDMWLKNLKYVHQLQNLYFALTQTELIIK